MKNLTFFVISIFIFSLIIVSEIFSQFEFKHDVFSNNNYNSFSSLVGGLLKPSRTDSSGGQPSNSTAYFPILIVFVQYANETEECDYWPIGYPPIYIDSLLSYDKKTSSNWWEAYDPQKEMISSWWQEVSGGAFHVTGQAVNVILDHDAKYYNNCGCNAEDKINQDVYEKLKLNQNIDWSYFDQWSKNANNGMFYNQPDHFIDMIYMVHRRCWNGGPTEYYMGYTPLLTAGGLTNYPIYINGNDTIFVNASYGDQGSGSKIAGKYRVVHKYDLLGVSAHEHGHYLFGSGHITYSKMTYGPGAEIYLSPWERLKLGYMNSTNINFSNQINYSLLDYSGRTDINAILKVPISTNDTNEFFLIANRTKQSPWDRTMSGDTAHDNPYRNINPDYGKGVYFYHITNGFEYPSTDVDIMDLECADGLFYWSRSGTFSADWEDPNNPTYSLPFYVRDSVSYNNDITTPGMSNRDEMDVSDPSWSGDSRKWGSEGKLQQSQYGDGTDRIYTNKNDRWTSRSCLGDRWDAWRIGYNVVFSPYSSPSTRNWNNNNTNIFIYMSDSSNNEVDFKIYKVGQNGFTLDSILKVTPPSRPMGLKLEYTECEYGMRYPKLIWSHNMEPDMIDSSYNPPFHIKHYKIYRAYSDMNSVPGTFNEIADVYANSSTQPYYIDYSTYAQCGGGIAQENYRVRYEIKAVDNTSWASVFSDFVSTSTYELHRDDGDVMNNLEPKVYSLSQNYPNPFNPVTNIKYSIAYQGFVSLKIYDILGREIRTLVNEVKTPGEYFISFNGVDLASGIYFYRIKAGNFVSVKRMVLIK